jgi:hypothetical protein
MTYPVDPATGQRHKPGPPLWICIVVIVVAAAMGITGLAVGITKVVHEFAGQVYVAPGSVQRHLTPGTYEVFAGVTSSDSDIPLRGRGITSVRVVGSGGATISPFAPSSHETLSRGATSYRGIYEFKVSQTGDYGIQVLGAPGEPFFISRSFGDSARHAAGWFVLFGAGLLVGIAGVVLLIVGIVRRSRARRQPYAYAAGGYQPGAPPPAGWYTDPQTPGTMRWWDGTRWTDQTQQPSGPTDSGPTDSGPPESSPS